MAEIHPAIPEAYGQLKRVRVSRREFLQLATLLGMSAAGAGVLTSRFQKDTLAATGAPADGTLVRGGTWRCAAQLPAIEHPAAVATIEGGNVLRQVSECLSQVGPDNIARPLLLARWQASEDVRTWTLTLRQGIQFNNGDEVTADDVIFTIGQWFDPGVGSSMGLLLAKLGGTHNVEKMNEYAVRLHLQEPDIGVPQLLAHIQGIVLHRDFAGDFLAQPIGTGAFTLESYAEGGLATLARRSNYWRTGLDGQPLPYLDELVYTSMDKDAARAALLADTQDTMFKPRLSDWEALKDAPGLSVWSAGTSHARVLRMRADLEPWSDERVRNALKLCQDRQAIVEYAYAGQGDLSVDAHVAPIHPAYCQKPIPAYDPSGASDLLSDAGHSEGLAVTLSVIEDGVEHLIAQKLQELAAPGGFDITLDAMPASEYWASWTQWPLGITAWAHRPLATTVLRLAYASGADWNETHWSDTEFDSLLLQAESTLGIGERRALMCQIEEIMQQRGPIGHSFWPHAWNITRSEFVNVEGHAAHYDLLTTVRKGGASDAEILDERVYLPSVAR
jgi:peptide/nickel transport system substrate-binding protein